MKTNLESSFENDKFFMLSGWELSETVKMRPQSLPSKELHEPNRRLCIVFPRKASLNFSSQKTKSMRPQAKIKAIPPGSIA